jgi:DNA replication protein DnaC
MAKKGAISPPTRSAGVVLPSYQCAVCRDSGWVVPCGEDGLPSYSQVVPCSCRVKQLAEEKRLRLLKLCELPPASEKYSFESYRYKGNPTLVEAYQCARELAEDKGLKWLTLSGHVDLGKTHLAVAICRKWLERGQPAKYIYVPEMLLWLKEAFDKQKYEEDRLSFASRIKMLCDIPLLVLDDLGTQKTTEWAMEQLNTIINHRYFYQLPLVITTNKALDSLPGDDEGRIASRLKRAEFGRVVGVEGEEYRKRRQA